MTEEHAKWWFETDQYRELVDTCEFVAVHAGLVALDDQSIRWLVIGSVLATQHACVCALDGNVGGGGEESVLPEKERIEALSWLQSDRKSKPPKSIADPKMLGPTALLKRVTDEAYLPSPYTLSMSSSEIGKFRSLVELRNHFTHRLPGGWLISKPDIPEMVFVCAKAIRWLALTAPSFKRHLEEPDSERIQSSLRHIEDAMDFLRAEFEGPI